jgi:hypothetical protein
LFIWLYRRFPRILDAITIVRPETVVRWHRMGFSAYWRWKSRPLGGRPWVDKQIRDLIRRMSFENPLWGAPKIHGELLKLSLAGYTTDTRESSFWNRQLPRRDGWLYANRNRSFRATHWTVKLRWVLATLRR